MSEKLYLEAIRALPEMWIRNGTFVNINSGKAYAGNPEFMPIVYDGKWKEITFPSPPRKIEPLARSDSYGPELTVIEAVMCDKLNEMIERMNENE